MTQFQLYVTSLAASLLLSLSVVFYLRKPLYRLLVEVCGTPDRARFWMHITNLSFVLTAMMMALTYQPFEDRLNFYFLFDHLGRTLFGLLGVTIFLTLTMSIFISRTDKVLLSERSHETAR